MAEGFIRLRSYWSPDEANLAKLHLESHGIPVELDNASFVATAWLDANAVGGVKLLVKNTDAEQAEQILSQRPGDDSDETTDGNADEANWQTEDNLDEDDSEDLQVLTGFRSLKRPLIWIYLLAFPLMMLVVFILNVFL